MSNDRHGPADGPLAAEIHEAVSGTTPAVGFSDDGASDASLPNLAALDGTEAPMEDLETVHPSGPLTLSSVTVDDSATTFFRLDPAAGAPDDVTAASVTLRENGDVRDVTLSSASGSTVDVVFVFDDAGGMYEEIVGAHAAAGPFVDALSTTGLDARVALVTAKDSIELRQDFTDDRSTFVGAVEDLSGSLGARHRAHGVELLGVATGHRSDADGRTLSPFRPGAHRVVVSVSDAPALVAGPAADDARTLADPGRFRDALADVTLFEIADVPPALDDAAVADALFAPRAGGTWFERPGSSPESIATILADEVPALLSNTYAATFTSAVDARAERTIELTVENDAGAASTTYRMGPRP